MPADMRPRLAAERRRDREQPRRGEPQEREDERREAAVDVERELARVRSGEERREPGLRELVRDVPAGVRGADDEHRAVAELLGPAVVGGVEQSDRGVELAGEGRRHRMLVLEDPRREDDVVRLEAPVAGRNDVSTVVAVEAVGPDAVHDGEREALGVRLEVLRHLEPQRVGVLRPREAHPRQPVDDRGRVEPERWPALPPGVADSLVRVEDHERAVPPREVVPHRKAGLPSADDDRLDPFRPLRCHDSSSRRSRSHRRARAVRRHRTDRPTCPTR